MIPTPTKQSISLLLKSMILMPFGRSCHVAWSLPNNYGIIIISQPMGTVAKNEAKAAAGDIYDRALLWQPSDDPVHQGGRWYMMKFDGVVTMEEHETSISHDG
jgi:hypothetical protein